METSKPGSARKFFNDWFAAINGENLLPRVHDKKLSILTLAALMEIPAANVPESLRDGWPGIVGGALKLFKELPKAIERKGASMSPLSMSNRSLTAIRPQGAADRDE